MTHGWWRENRLWVSVLPLALAALLLASSYNVKGFWYVNGLHDRIGSADPGDFASATDHYEDTVGPTSRTFRVRLTGVEEAPLYPFEEDEEDEEDGPRPPPTASMRSSLTSTGRPSPTRCCAPASCRWLTTRDAATTSRADLVRRVHPEGRPGPRTR